MLFNNSILFIQNKKPPRSLRIKGGFGRGLYAKRIFGWRAGGDISNPAGGQQLYGRFSPDQASWEDAGKQQTIDELMHRPNAAMRRAGNPMA
jgi:hypothetical protein